ncbi:hypothetical protein Q3G72_030460 [Acer saccharum]|nr:hypothetical protein Q3G72_030460 [Acer saccharum]
MIFKDAAKLFGAIVATRSKSGVLKNDYKLLGLDHGKRQIGLSLTYDTSLEVKHLSVIECYHKKKHGGHIKPLSLIAQELGEHIAEHNIVALVFKYPKLDPQLLEQLMQQPDFVDGRVRVTEFVDSIGELDPLQNVLYTYWDEAFPHSNALKAFKEYEQNTFSWPKFKKWKKMEIAKYTLEGFIEEHGPRDSES